MEQYDIFISYRRDGGESTAKMIRDKLAEQGYRVFFDVESLRSGNFNTKLYSVIDECKDFLVVLSPGALDRCVNEDDWVRREIEYALMKEKNVVPVLTRGFQFPDRLPESIEPLRFRNGLESSTQFFDAFISQLAQKFFQSRPQIKHVFKRKKWLIPAVLLAAAALVFGAVWGIQKYQGIYPRTAADKNAAEELLQYTGSNLSRISLIAESYQNALQSGKRYLTTADTSPLTISTELSTARYAIEQIDISAAAPTDHLLTALESSPISTADAKAMNEEANTFKSEALDAIRTLRHELLDTSGSIHTATEKMELIERYETILNETLKANAYCVNDLLLPIRDQALRPFWQDTLPYIPNIPLSETTWIRDKEQLRTLVLTCLENIKNQQSSIYQVFGNVRSRSSDDTLDIIQSNEGKWLADWKMLLYAEADDLRIRIDHGIEMNMDTSELEIREQWYLVRGYQSEDQIDLSNTVPTDQDDMNTLMDKAQYLIGMHMDQTALKCLDTLIAMAVREDDKAAAEGWKGWLESLPQTGIRYGVLVCGYDESSPEKNSVLQLGDVIIAVNGAECHTYEEYIALKAAADQAFTVTVLRKNESGRMSEQTLDMTKDMPLVYLNDAAFSLQHYFEESWRALLPK